MIPAGGFLAVAPIGHAPNYVMPPVVLAYRERNQIFTDSVQTPPFDLVSLIEGSFAARLLSDGISLTVELTRTGVYGTILVDSLDFDLVTFPTFTEPCPASVPVFDDVIAAVNFADETSVAVLMVEE